MEQIEVVMRHQHRMDRFVWVHAQNEHDHNFHWKVASLGAWVEFDGINRETARWHEQCVMAMLQKDQLDRTLIGQDSGWYHVGEPGGGQFNGYTYIYEYFLPGLRKEWQEQLMMENPRKAFR